MSVFRRLAQSVAITTLFLSTASVHAVPVLTHGGLDWLALTDTQTLSPADALAANAGYRHATAAEVTAMWSGAFGMSLTTGNAGGLASNMPGATDFLNTFGCTVTCGSAYSGLGSTLGPLAQAFGILSDGGTNSPFGTGWIKHNTGSGKGNAIIALANLINGNVQYGNYLVRDSQGQAIPEPATVLLIGLAIIGFGSARRIRTL